MENKEKTPIEPQKKNKKLLLIIISVLLLTFLLITVLTAIFLLKKPEPKVKIQTQESFILVPMREFLVNLIDYGGRRFLKASIDLEVEHQKVVQEIESKETILRNYIINILSSKTFNDVKSVEGKNEIRKAIILKSNFILKTGKVLNVYFKEFIIQ